MNNFVRNLNQNNKIGVMLLYGENGSYIPVDMLYLLTTFHICSKYDLKNENVLYYNDDAHFVSNDDNKIIVVDAENCVKLFRKYVNISSDFSLEEADFDIFKRYENVLLSKYNPYSLDDVHAYYKNGLREMGRNYSLVPVIIDKEDLYVDDYLEELEERRNDKKYADFKLVRKLKKRLNLEGKDGSNE